MVRVLKVSSESPSEARLREAAEVLREGGLVAFPTETVYGLGARADRAEAVAKIFAAKGRPAYNPLIVHVAEVSQAKALVTDWDARADALAARFWPGPLTLVLGRDTARVVDAVAAGGPTVAVRCPAHPVALGLLRVSGLPVAAPSANRFQALSPTTAEHVVAGLGDRVDLVVDGGSARFGIESTVVRLTSTGATLLRPGALTLTALREALPEIEVLHHSVEESGEALPSPGMVAKHYAPRARLLVVRRGDEASAVESLRAEGHTRIACVVLAGDGAVAHAERVELPRDAEGYGAALYATLHALDDRGMTAVVVREVPDDDDWMAVRDRLGRASHV